MVLAEKDLRTRMPGDSEQLQTPQVNIEKLVEHAKAGDEQTYIALDGLLDSKLRGGFRSMGDLGPDLLQDTKLRILSNLDNFDPSRGKRGDFGLDWLSWSRQIARNVRRDEFRRQRRKPPQTELNEEKNPEIVLEENRESEVARPTVNFSELFRTKIDDLLPPLQREVVKLALDGLSPPDIAKALGKTENNVKASLHIARLKIERKLIFPAGYRRLASFTDEIFAQNHLVRAIKQGKIEAVKFLNLYYTTDEAVAIHKARTKPALRRGDYSLESGGYFLAADVASSNAEYSAILISDFAVKSGGRWYIMPKDLEEMRENRSQRKTPRTFIKPSEGFSDRVKIANTLRDYQFIMNAAKKGRIRAERVRNRIFVIEEEAKRILAERDAQKSTRALSRAGTS